MGHSESYFWNGKTFAAPFFSAVPFGLNAQGMNGWLYAGGGIELWREVYSPSTWCVPVRKHGRSDRGVVPQSVRDRGRLRGLNTASGLPGEVIEKVGVAVNYARRRDLPRGRARRIDAAEWVGPYKDRRLGLQRVAKNYYPTGWHETATVSELLINKAAWDKLPKDLQAIVENACAACNVISEGWCQRTNAEAMEDLVKNQGVIGAPAAGRRGRRRCARLNDKVLAEGGIKDPLTKKVHDSYMAYLAKYKAWSSYEREEVYHDKILT